MRLISGCHVFAACVVAGSVLAGQAAAAINWTENWTGYASNSNIPTTPWQTRGVATGDTDSITTVGGRALINNTATGGTNPQLVLSLPQAVGSFVTTPIDFSFSYTLPANYGTSSQIILSINQYVDGVSTEAIRILLGPNYEGTTSAYWDATGRHAIGIPFVANETVTITLANIDITTGTYTLNWSSASGSGSINAAFKRSGIVNLGEVVIGESSADTSASQIYIGSVSITSSAVPEAASLSVLSLGAVAMLSRRHR